MWLNVLLSVLCIAVSVRSGTYIFNTGKILRKGVLTDGIVTARAEHSFLFGLFSSPVVEFTTNQGLIINSVFKHACLLKNKKNEKVTVIYDPASPQEFFIDSGYSDVINFLLLSFSLSALLIVLYKW